MSRDQKAEVNIHETLEEYFRSNYEEKSCSVLFADLTHDGQNELIVIQMFDKNNLPVNLETTTITENNFEMAKFDILQLATDNTVKVLYTDIISCTVAGYGQYYLYENNGKHYLFNYSPSERQGFARHSYIIFHLDNRGKIIKSQEDDISFSLHGDKWFDESYGSTEDEIAEFNAYVKKCLDRAVPLICFFEDRYGNVTFSFLEISVLEI